MWQTQAIAFYEIYTVSIGCDFHASIESIRQLDKIGCITFHRMHQTIRQNLLYMRPEKKIETNIY